MLHGLQRWNGGVVRCLQLQVVVIVHGHVHVQCLLLTGRECSGLHCQGKLMVAVIIRGSRYPMHPVWEVILRYKVSYELALSTGCACLLWAARISSSHHVGLVVRRCKHFRSMVQLSGVPPGY